MQTPDPLRIGARADGKAWSAQRGLIEPSHEYSVTIEQRLI